MKKIFLVKLCILLFITSIFAQERIELAGKWQFAIDSLDKGIKEKWYLNSFNETINLPGSMAENGKGNTPSINTHWTGDIVDSSFFKLPLYDKYRKQDNFKIPFWLQPEKHYYGAAWYKNEITIPGGWQDKIIEIFFERAHWQSTLWIDSTLAGEQNGLGAPHIFNLAEGLAPGKHTITVRIDNRINNINPGVNSHSVSDHTQTNWNGIVGDMYIEAKTNVHFGNIRVFPFPSEKKIKVELQVLNTNSSSQNTAISLQASGEDKQRFKVVTKDVLLAKEITNVTIDYELGEDAELWDEFSPAVYTLQCTLTGNNTRDSKEVPFGLREIGIKGTNFTINGREIFLRGTLECAIFPKTGYPSTDEKEWLRIFEKCKEYGLNHMRFHSWCPPEAAFAAADKAGIYLLVECSSWANQGSSLGDGNPIDNYIYAESERIVNEFGNHPSFCFMAYGNEPGGKYHEMYLARFISQWKDKDNRRLYTAAAGWPALKENDFHSMYEPRIQWWGAGLGSIINSQPPSTSYDWQNVILSKNKPIVSHEIGQWCVFPNFDEIKKYDGLLHAKNFEIFRETLKENGMEQLADSFLHASGKLQVLCYKAEIEAALRTKGMGGFQLLDLHDFPGQGTALVGVLDPFWEEKGYVTAKEYTQFCNTTVPLARITKMIFNSNEDFIASLEIAHYGAEALNNITPAWKIYNASGKMMAEGKLSPVNIPIGNVIKLGSMRQSLAGFKTPDRYTFEVTVDKYTNKWDFWVYPYEYNEPLYGNDIKIVRKLDDEAVKFLENGGMVLLSPVKGTVKASKGGDIAVGFSSIFWNTAWTLKQAPHTLGILCNPEHPLFNFFPTEYHSNFQWWDVMSHSSALLLSELGNVQPIVRIIDDWFTNRPLGLIAEAKAGNGKIMITGIDLLTDAEKRPEAKQLTYSILKYMRSSGFNPAAELQINKIRELINE
jgi:hypothetical protein